MKRLLMTGTLLSAAVLWMPQPAEACGGFFCSRAPIDQSGEKIAFAVGDGHIDVHVQIQYAGDARQFSWVVPLHARPELSVGSPQLFAYLDGISSPRFQLDWQQTGGFCPGRTVFDEVPTSPAPSADGGVTVVSQEQVGPYDAAILQATDADALTQWLTTNSYDLTPAGQTAIAQYVAPDFYFVALKLQQNKGTGDLRPIVLKMNGAPPCIPLRLTAIAARPNMPIIAYVFANNRSVPQNYRHVLINETKIDWLNGGNNYRQVATDAVDEAGGKAFLTEYAGTVRALIGENGGLTPTLRRFDTAKLSLLPHPVEFAEELMRQGFSQDPSIQSLLRKYIPLPASLVGQVSELQFYNQLSFYRGQIDADPGRPPFNATAFATELQDTIVAPMQGAQTLFEDFPYLTRLFTTMSAEEMDVDPELHFNNDLGDVSNVHRAKATLADACGEAFGNARVKIELPDGRWFFQTFVSGPLLEGPSAARVESLEASGPPVVLQDNTAAINKVIEHAGGGIPGAGCGCTSVDSVGGLLALGGLLSLSLRRRARRP